MNMPVNSEALKTVSYGNRKVFANAFKECGIGGRFSKFQIVQSNDWFELLNIDSLEDARFCYRVYDRLDTRKYRNVTFSAACTLHREDPQWTTHIQTAQLVLNKILSKGNNKGETRYYIDDFHKSVFLINRMFVIEVTPVYREVPEVGSYAIYDFIETHTAKTIDPDDVITVHAKYGKVVAGWNGQIYNSLLTPEEFNVQYGEHA